MWSPTGKSVAPSATCGEPVEPTPVGRSPERESPAKAGDRAEGSSEVLPNQRGIDSRDDSRCEEESRHYVDRGVSLEERRHRSEKFQCRVPRSARRPNFLPASALQTQLGGRTKAQTHCLRSGWLAPRLLSRVNNSGRPTREEK